MGLYVNSTYLGDMPDPFDGKCEALLQAGAEEVEMPKSWIPNLVCVVDNRVFGAAAYLYSPSELKDFSDPKDARPKRWFVWNQVGTYAM